MRNGWLVISTLLLALSVGCHTSSPLPGAGWFARNPPTFLLEGTRAEMRAEVMHHLPVGTPIEDAREVVRYNGFAIRKSAEADPKTMLWTKRRHAGADVSYEWRVELRHDGEKITGVDVAMLGFGPDEADEAAPRVTENTGG